MTATDQAFIRAYGPQTDHAAAATAASAPTRYQQPSRPAPASWSPPSHGYWSQPPQAAVPPPALPEPALEVAAFPWTETGDALLAEAGRQIETAAARLLESHAAGTQIIGVVSGSRGDGCSTTAACLARQLAKHNVETLLVDADFAAPGLADELGLALEHGWDNVLVGEKPLEEALVYSQHDRLTAMLLSSQAPRHATALGTLDIAGLIYLLQRRYALMVIDLGPLAEMDCSGAALIRMMPLSGLLAVAAAGGQSPLGEQVINLTRSANLPILGLVENFVSETVATRTTSASAA